MTIENLKQIAIKYATTKGSRVPLAPDELCNAVVQYFNEFLKITADINTIQVAVTEEGGNIVFTITGNTLDGKAFTPIVITVEHNDFVTDQEFEEFKTSVTEQLNNKLNKITSPISNFVLYANIEGNDTQINYTSGPTPNSILYRDETGKTSVVKGVSGQNVANMENIADVEAKIPDVSGFATKDELNNKLSKSNSKSTVYAVESNGNQSNVPYGSGPSPYSFVFRGYNSNFVVNSPTENGNPTPKSYVDNAISNVETKIPSTDNFLLKNVVNIINYSKFKIIDEIGSNILGKANASNNMSIGSSNYALQLNSSIRPIIYTPDFTYNVAYTSDIPEYTNVDSVSYDSINGAIVAYDGANEIHIPLLAGDNVTIDASEDNKKIVISAAGGGGAGDVTAAGNNTFTGENTFTNEITFNTMKSEAGGIQFGNFEGITENGYNYSSLNDYQFVMQKFVGTDDYYETVITADLITYKPAGNNNVYEFHFPNKSGTFAMTTDIIKDHIYFISFYANDPSEPCHLIGTMMSKNSYGTGQKTNEEFAVMLADNFYANSNEGLAAYGKLAGKDILCIYSDDGLSIRCLNEENSEVDLPTVMFFVMETEL